MQKITPFLWFDNNAEEAITFYKSVFKDSKILNANRFGEGGPGKDGKFMTGTIELLGQEFMVLNAGPMFKFNEAISFFISVETQEEVDYYWEKLSGGGSKSQCGWLKDQFGLSWQVVPTILGKLMNSGDPVKSKKVVDAMMKMSKLDIAALKKAAE
jgi:predicted 3-demethylubiquinone-9 3-methyltransferase (glyoxalase superfamily)